MATEPRVEEGRGLDEIISEAAPEDEDECPLQEHLRFYGPKGAYCGACKVPL